MPMMRIIHFILVSRESILRFTFLIRRLLLMALSILVYEQEARVFLCDQRRSLVTSTFFGRFLTRAS